MIITISLKLTSKDVLCGHKMCVWYQTSEDITLMRWKVDRGGPFIAKIMLWCLSTQCTVENIQLLTPINIGSKRMNKNLRPLGCSTLFDRSSLLLHHYSTSFWSSFDRLRTIAVPRVKYLVRATHTWKRLAVEVRNRGDQYLSDANLRGTQRSNSG